MRAIAFRLRPGVDLKAELERIARDDGLLAGFILTAVGSLSRARLRMPGGIGSEPVHRALEGPLEIVSLVGTLGPDGAHLHIALSGSDGACVGGHLAPGCVVHTTAEVVVGELEEQVFRRTEDAETGFKELDIRPRTPCRG